MESIYIPAKEATAALPCRAANADFGGGAIPPNNDVSLLPGTLLLPEPIAPRGRRRRQLHPTDAPRG